VLIAEASQEDVVRVLAVEREAFGTSDEADLVSDLLDDSTARPLLSLLAWEEDEAVGHILFTTATLAGADDLTVSILAPLAVVPHAQRRGIGGRLIEHGVEHLAQAGVDLVFVLGHPDYYPRHGFVPAIPLGFEAPYPITPQEAWMVRALRPGLVGDVRGTIVCAEVLDHPEYWRE
jgi:putative acetyltransferase